MQMKMIVAFIQPFMESKVMDVLLGMREVSGVTFEMVRGFGRGRLANNEEAGVFSSFPKVRMEIVVAENAADLVCKAIQAAAHTGRAGDGKIFLLPVENAIRISTGEEGEQAI